MSTLQTKIRKWGNSHGVILPKEVLDSPHFNQGTRIDISITDDAITLRPTPHKQKKLSLADMVKGMKKTDRHECIDFGSDVGREVW